MQRLSARPKPRVIRAIEADNLGAAKLLLVEGFPNRSADFWSQSIERILRIADNDKAGVPLGYFLMDGDLPVGLVLTPASIRRSANSIHAVINLSSWYIRPDHRWRAGLMLRTILEVHDAAAFTDLTPTSEVRRILTAFGFTQISSGIDLHALPVSALAPARGAFVCDLDSSRAYASAGLRKSFANYQEIGCIAIGLEAGSQSYPLLLKTRRLKGLPAARLVYCGSNSALARHLAALARFLIRRGIIFLETDAGSLPDRKGHISLPAQLKFMRSRREFTINPDKTDYLGSELCLLDI